MGRTIYLWLDGRTRRWKQIPKKEWDQKLNSGRFPASHFASTTSLKKPKRRH